MEIVNRVSRMASITTKLLSTEVKIGLVPTLGAIHPGHLGLIQAARSMSDLVVVSIFVNRLEFFTDEEYQKHPVDITKDVDELKNENVDYIFAPLEQEMYPPDFLTYVEVAEL
jgi:pantoate--beta-alanine ligase